MKYACQMLCHRSKRVKLNQIKGRSLTDKAIRFDSFDVLFILILMDLLPPILI